MRSSYSPRCQTSASSAPACPSVRPHRACRLRYGPRNANGHRIVCHSSYVSGSLECSLTRSQAGRRQRARRKSSSQAAAPGLGAHGNSWTRSHASSSSLQWLEGAKEQPTEVLLDALLGHDALPQQRLPVLLTLLEGRPNLEACLAAVGVARLVDAVSRSELLQRLLPGGILHELLLGLLEEQAAELTSCDLFTAARTIAVWPPPSSADSISRSAAAVAAAVAAKISEAGLSGSRLWEASDAAEAAMLAQALTQMHPWLLWLSAEAATSDAVSDGWDAPEASTADASALLLARQGVAELLGQVATAEAAAALDPAAVNAVMVAAACYDVEIPQTAKRAAVSLASATSTSYGRDQTGVVDELVAQLVVAHAASARRCGSCNTGALTADDVCAMVARRLGSQLGSEQTIFLRLLLGCMRWQRTQEHGSTPSWGDTAEAAVAEGRREVHPYAGLLQAIAAAAERLDCEALALGMECAAEAAAAGPAGSLVGLEAARRLLGAAYVLAEAPLQGPTGAFTADQLCHLAAAALRLWHAAASGDTGAGGRVAALLELVEMASLQKATMGSIARLLAAVCAARTAHGDSTVAQADPQKDAAQQQWPTLSSPWPVPPGLQDVLLRHLAAAAAGAEAADAGGSSATAAAAAGVASASGAPHTPCEEALALLGTAVTTAEDAVAAATSTSSANAELPAQRAVTLRAACHAACSALEPAVRGMDASAATRLLHLVARADRAGVRPDCSPLMWALHERLRTLAPALAPPDVLKVIRGCVALRWRPGLLVRELLLPLVQDLQAGDSVELQQESASRKADGSALASDGPAPRAAGCGALQWTAVEVQEVLVLLAAQAYSGPLAAATVKLGVGAVLRHRRADGMQLAPADLSTLLWVCVAARYRNMTVLRSLLEQLLQAPAAQVPVRVVSQAVWAAARLGVVGERLVRWAVRACEGEGKLEQAPPQSLANLCWGLAKLGLSPPRAFVSAVMAACVKQLPGFKQHELPTALFVLATWGARLGGSAEAAAVTQQLVAARHSLDAASMCNAAWALQRLTASRAVEEPTDGATGVEAAYVVAPRAPAASGGRAAGHGAPVLDAAVLAAIEERLLDLIAPADPRAASHIPDHHMYRFFAAAAAASASCGGGYRPTRLIQVYAASLRSQLPALAAWPPSQRTAAFRSRQLWAVSQSLAVTGLRDPELLSGLEVAADTCQAVLRPRHLAGLLHAMAALGHYPATWVRRGLLRRVGRALQSATVQEAALILEALSAWRVQLYAGEEGAPEAAEARSSGLASTVQSGGAASARMGALQSANGSVTGKPAAELAAQDALQQGSGWAAAGEKEQERGISGRGQPQLVRYPTRQRLDLLRQVALTRLKQLCVLAPLGLPPLPPADSMTTASVSSPLQQASTPLSSLPPSTAPHPPEATAGLDGAPAAPPAAAAGGQSDGAAAAIKLNDAMRLLCALARLRWRCLPVESVLLRVAAQLSVAQRRRVPELSTLLWALASMRHDAPELLDDLQAALLGQPRQRTLAEEITMLETGRAGAAAASAAAPVTLPGAPAAAPPANEVPPLPPGPQQPHATAPAEQESAKAQTPAAIANPLQASIGSQADNANLGNDGGDVHFEQETAAHGSDAPSPPVPIATVAPRPPNDASNASLLERPAKPEQRPGTALEAVPAPFDPATAMAAAAAAANRRLDEQLGGPLGRAQLPTEPWRPADVYKVLWACAKMNRHPGPQVLAAAERSWFLHTAGPDAERRNESCGGSGGSGAPSRPPLHAMSGLLWALSVFRHHNSLFAHKLAKQLAERLREPEEMAAVGRQALQLAACLLAAQADRADSPLLTALSPEFRARLVVAWRGRLAARAAKQPNRYQADLVSVLRKMGLTAAANVATPDGCVVVDVAVALMGPGAAVAGARPSAAAQNVAPRLLALELVGRHNSAANSPRILGEAVLKYRLLQARGYMVVPVLCHEWDRISHQDVWTKMVYLQAKIGRLAGGGPTAAVAPGLRTSVSPGLVT